MKKQKIVLIVLVSLVLVYKTSSVTAFLTCANFTDYEDQYREDCDYVEEADLDFLEEQAVLLILWTESYEYEGDIWEYQPTTVIVPDYEAEAQDLDTSTMLTAWNVFILGLINYGIFSVLTKSSWFLQWLSVGS